LAKELKIWILLIIGRLILDGQDLIHSLEKINNMFSLIFIDKQICGMCGVTKLKSLVKDFKKHFKIVENVFIIGRELLTKGYIFYRIANVIMSKYRTNKFGLHIYICNKCCYHFDILLNLSLYVVFHTPKYMMIY
jgi:hypothetical protein